MTVQAVKLQNRLIGTQLIIITIGILVMKVNVQLLVVYLIAKNYFQELALSVQDDKSVVSGVVILNKFEMT